jgi:hypothetical protein
MKTINPVNQSGLSMTAIGSLSSINPPFSQAFRNNQVIAAFGLAEAKAEKLAASIGRSSAIPAGSSKIDSFGIGETSEKQPDNPAAKAAPGNPAPSRTPPMAAGQPFVMSSDMQAILLATQEVASDDESAAAVSPESAKTTENFLELAAMTPVERYIHGLLKSLGLTEESLAELPPEERIKIEKFIKEKLREQFTA